MDQSNIKEVSELIRSSKKVLLVTHSRPSLDAICSLASVYKILKESYKKDIDVSIPAELSRRQKELLQKAGIEDTALLTDLPQRVYTISIKKKGEKIESINFNEEADTFNFFITPFNGSLDLDSVSIKEAGANYDLIVTIDTPSLNFLSELYKNNKAFFDSTNIISFDAHKSNAGYGLHSVTWDDVDTTSQIVTRFFRAVNVSFDQALGDMLLAGMYSYTDNDTKVKIRKSLFEDMGALVEKGANLQHVHSMLYAPYNLNEIFLVGDILDSSNEGTAAKLKDIKVVGCKINLNKEELQTTDMDKTAQVVFWNIHIPDYGFAYVIFQRSATESVAYFHSFDEEISVSDVINAFDGKGDKHFGKAQFNMDMNAVEAKIKDEFGITFTQKSSSFGNTFNSSLDDFGDGFDDSFMPKMDEGAFPPASFPSFAPSVATTPQPSTPAPEEDAPQGNDASKSDTPARFDPRLGK